MEITLENINGLLNTENIVATWLGEHSKASEKYVDVSMVYTNPESSWTWSIPYYYRRTWVFCDSAESIVDLLRYAYEHLSPEKIERFVSTEKSLWNAENSGRKVTKPFFDVLINLWWKSAKEFPSNTNPARRIQDIKEMWYWLATVTKWGTKYMLVPMPKGNSSWYEVMSPAFKKKAIQALAKINAYELGSANAHWLLPDHKFPEIRWDHETREENPESMSDADIRTKFQLLDNQRNQQKREVCRKCFQESKRWIIFWVNFFYKGGVNWDSRYPQVGKMAEQGCVWCGWYDIEAWRKALNKLIEDSDIS